MESPSSAPVGREEPTPGTDTGYPQRGDIYYVNFDPVVGSEQGGRRPALIIQNDVSNQVSPVVIAAAFTSKKVSRQRPTNIPIPAGESGIDLPSVVMLNQIRTIDKRRLSRYIGRLSAERMEQVDEAIRVSLGLVPL